MPWSFNGERPIYSQLVEQLQLLIVTGAYPPGSRISPVRELALEAAVNPNTMQRALAELEKQELVFSQRTSGRFVTEDEERIAALRQKLAEEKLSRFFTEMEDLGYKKGDIIKLISKEGET